MKNIVFTKTFAPKFRSEWSDREVHSSHGDYFRDHFCVYASGPLSGNFWPNRLDRLKVDRLDRLKVNRLDRLDRLGCSGSGKVDRPDRLDRLADRLIGGWTVEWLAYLALALPC